MYLWTLFLDGDMQPVVLWMAVNNIHDSYTLQFQAQKDQVPKQAPASPSKATAEWTAGKNHRENIQKVNKNSTVIFS